MPAAVMPNPIRASRGSVRRVFDQQHGREDREDRREQRIAESAVGTFQIGFLPAQHEDGGAPQSVEEPRNDHHVGEELVVAAGERDGRGPEPLGECRVRRDRARIQPGEGAEKGPVPRHRVVDPGAREDEAVRGCETGDHHGERDELATEMAARLSGGVGSDRLGADEARERQSLQVGEVEQEVDADQ